MHAVFGHRAVPEHTNAIDALDRYRWIVRESHRERRLERPGQREVVEGHPEPETRRWLPERPEARTLVPVRARAAHEPTRAAPAVAGSERERSIERETIRDSDHQAFRGVEGVGRRREPHVAAQEHGAVLPQRAGVAVEARAAEVQRSVVVIAGIADAVAIEVLRDR